MFRDGLRIIPRLLEDRRELPRLAWARREDLRRIRAPDLPAADSAFVIIAVGMGERASHKSVTGRILPAQVP